MNINGTKRVAFLILIISCVLLAFWEIDLQLERDLSEVGVTYGSPLIFLVLCNSNYLILLQII